MKKVTITFHICAETWLLIGKAFLAISNQWPTIKETTRGGVISSPENDFIVGFNIEHPK